MKTLTTPIAVVNNVNQINKWKVLYAVDHDDMIPPYLEVIVQAQGGGAKVYPAPGATYQLIAVDTGLCTCLVPNPTSTLMTDQIMTLGRTLSGTPYTTIAAANTGTKNASRLAVEAACLSTGLVDAALTGT